MKTDLEKFAGECAAANTEIDTQGKMMIVVVLPDLKTLDGVTAELQKRESYEDFRVKETVLLISRPLEYESLRLETEEKTLAHTFDVLVAKYLFPLFHVPSHPYSHLQELLTIRSKVSHLDRFTLVGITYYSVWLRMVALMLFMSYNPKIDKDGAIEEFEDKCNAIKQHIIETHLDDDDSESKSEAKMDYESHHPLSDQVLDFYETVDSDHPYQVLVTSLYMHMSSTYVQSPQVIFVPCAGNQ